MTELFQKKCTACTAGAKPLTGEALNHLMAQLKDWKLIDNHHIEKEYKFRNFKEALDFTNAIGSLAEEEGHHPDVFLSWGRVKLTFWTHKIEGLTESDFIMAAKSDIYYSPKKTS